MSQSNVAKDQIHLAISTCPNDTFAFHAILNQKIDLEGIDFQIELLDISQLNDGLFAGKFDVAKASFHAALLLADQTVVLPSGGALGFGVGPLLLAARENTSPADMPAVNEGASAAGGTLTLCPGPHTTATLLMKLFYGDAIEQQRTRVEHRVFSDIMPALQKRAADFALQKGAADFALQKGAADFGVCIHEGRFTWQAEGLYLVEDLGVRWEAETHCPLPLGGILARRTIPGETLSRIQRVVRRSVQYGLANRDETLPTMRQYAQEFDDDVLLQHVDLYVNDWTVDLGSQGAEALARLAKSFGQRSLEIVGQ